MSSPTKSSNRPAAKGRPSAAARRSEARRRQRKRLLLRVAVIAAAAIAALFLIARAGSGGGGSSNAASGPVFAVGQPGPGEPAPDFTLPSTAGGSFQLADQRGKTTLLYFHEGLGCQPCWDQMRDIEKDWADFEALGIDQVVAIAGNPLAELRQKADDDDLSTPVLADPDLTLGRTYEANQYGMMGTSTYGHSFVVVGPDGEIRWRADYGGSPDYTMYVGTADLLNDLRTGLNSETPSP